MATTQLTDIFVGDYYASLEPVNSPEKTAVYESGNCPILSMRAHRGVI